MSTTAVDIQQAAAVPERIIEAWRTYDAQAFAEVFTPDGTMSMPGLFKRGQDEIAEFMTQAFAGPYRGTQVVGSPFDVHVVSDDVVVLTTEGGVRAVDAEKVPDNAVVRATWVLVRDGAAWRLASYTNTPK